MKKMITVAALLLVPFTSFAQPISLQPGSSVVINGDVVSCLGPSEQDLPPACSIRQDGSYYRLYAGNSIAQSFHTFEHALDGAKRMKAAGLCR
ncbi:hypothetical protein D3C87_88130 [compost metagenome]